VGERGGYDGGGGEGYDGGEGGEGGGAGCACVRAGFFLKVGGGFGDLREEDVLDARRGWFSLGDGTA